MAAAKVRHGVSHDIIYIALSRQNAIRNDMQLNTSTYADSSPYHQITSSAERFFLHEYRVISRVLISPHPNTSGATLQTESGFVRKQHLTPITLHPISMFSCPLLSGCRVSCCQRNNIIVLGTYRLIA
ncbi:hypothetical protein TNCV_917141 [Trichonephila clavipes]|nr:hypothetical protein TNCV_917141 [Trichonephila clavipes]